MIKQVVLIVFPLTILAGCGNDESQNEQIAELQDKVLDLDEKLKQTGEELKALGELNQRLIARLNAKDQGTSSDSRRTPQVRPQSKIEKSLPKSREDMKSLAKKRSELKRGQFVVEKAKRVIYSMLSRMSLDELVERMNEAEVLHPDGASWTRPRLEAFIQEHRIERRAQK